MALDTPLPGWVGAVIGSALRLFGRRGGDGLQFPQAAIDAELARRAAQRPPPPRPPGRVHVPAPSERAPGMPRSPPPPGRSPGWLPDIPTPTPVVAEDGVLYGSYGECIASADAQDLDWFEYCGPQPEGPSGPTAGPVAPIGLPRFWWPALELPIPRGKRGSSPREVWEDCVRVVGPEKAPFICGPSSRRPDDWQLPTIQAGGNVFLPTLPEVVPVVAPAVREILRRVIPIIVPMLPDWFPQPAPQPIPRGPTKRPRVRPPVETPDLEPFIVDPAWRVIHPYPIPAPFPTGPVVRPRRGPLQRPRIAPRPSPVPTPGPSPGPSSRPGHRPTPRPSPFRLPRVAPYLLPFAYPLLFPTGPQVFPDFGLPQPTPRPPGSPPRGAPKPIPPTSPLTPFQPGPLELGQPQPFRLGNDPCQCTDTKPKRKPRKPRSECREGTYRETARGTLKRPQRKIPCR
jgi:hypothetical protein